jgi:hypothetical protein
MRKRYKLEQSPNENTYDYNLASTRRTKAGGKRRQHSDGKGSSRTVMDHERYGMYSVRSVTSTNDIGSSEFLRDLSVNHVKPGRATARKNILRGPFLGHRHPECMS